MLIGGFFNKLFLYQSIATLTTLVSLRLLLFFRRRLKRFSLLKETGVPVPKLSIFYGNYHHYRDSEALYLIDAKFAQEFGKCYGIFFGDEPNLVISDKDMLKKIFLESSKSFQERTHNFLDTPLTDGILFAKYHRWKFMRSVLAQPFSMYTVRGDSSTNFIEDSIKLMIDYIENKRRETEESNHKVRLDIHGLMKSTSLYLISALAVKLPGVQVVENEPNVESLDSFLDTADKGVIEYVIMFPLLKPFFQFLATHLEYDKTMSLIHKSLNKLIDEDVKKLNGTSRGIVSSNKQSSHVLDTLIKLHRDGRLSRREVIGNVDTLLFAGYDTTSTTLTYLFWVIGKNLSIQEKLRNELKAHGTDSEYLLQVIKETMRLYPTVISFTSRLATENVEIDGLRILKGCRVTFNAWLMHRDPTLWPEPEKFDPDRFNGKNIIHPCAYAPFGLGDRRCLGYHLAILEMKMVICDILLRYTIKTLEPEILELKSHANSLTAPKDRVYIELEKLTFD